MTANLQFFDAMLLRRANYVLKDFVPSFYENANHWCAGYYTGKFEKDVMNENFY